MKGIFKFILILGACLLSLVLIKVLIRKEINHAFYYWVTDQKTLSPVEMETIKKHKVNKLYVKFFEVERQSEENVPVEKSILKLSDLKGLEIIPTVYIRNEVFKKSASNELKELASNLSFLIEKIYKRNYNSTQAIKEIQIDCDWTIQTQKAYFEFLKELKRLNSDIEMSATLRLYAFKFPNKMGVLPTDRAMLMCYNLLSPIESENRNSILDLVELKKYLNGSKKYPVKLDVALPIYSDVQVYHNSTFQRIIYNEDPKEMSSFPTLNNLWKKVENDTVFHDVYLRRGDLLKHEWVSVNLLTESSKVIRNIASSGSFETTSLFHLKEEELKYYSHEELGAIYNFFNRH